jgi:hypothetical protein
MLLTYNIINRRNFIRQFTLQFINGPTEGGEFHELLREGSVPWNLSDLLNGIYILDYVQISFMYGRMIQVNLKFSPLI